MNYLAGLKKDGGKKTTQLFCVTLTFLSLIFVPLACGGALQQLLQVMFEDCGVQLLSLTSENAARHLSAVEVHKLPPAH